MATTESTPRGNAPIKSWIALLGCKDEPADGVEDYCVFLGRALEKRGVRLERVRVPWRERGWLSALRELWREASAWYGRWVLLQYTALSWSRRGFPIGILAALAILKRRGVRCAVVFHEPSGFRGPRWIDRARGACQGWVVRALHRFSKKSIFTVPLNTVPKLPRDDERSAFIPLGANIPENLTNRSSTPDRNGVQKTVAVFCVSEPPHREQEISDIYYAARTAATDGTKLRVIFVGRGTFEAKAEIESAFKGSSIDVVNRGFCDGDEVSHIFGESDAMLAVRGKLNLRRASALAGLACGLPIIGYGGAARGTVIEEAGVALVPYGDQQELGKALQRVLTDPDLWKEMHEKNRHLQQEYFSWDVVAGSYVEFLAERRY
ncbi:MAG: glycosyltransferase family 4 protein [Candidatus Acidiferrales bacterium]